MRKIPSAAHENRPRPGHPLRPRHPSSFSRLLCTTALVSAAFVTSITVPSVGQAAPNYEAPSGECGTVSEFKDADGKAINADYYGVWEKTPQGVDKTYNISACHTLESGEAYVSGLWLGKDLESTSGSGDWDGLHNKIIIRGTISVEATGKENAPEKASGETRAIHVEKLNGSTNTLINYATLSAISKSNGNPAEVVGSGISKSFGIYTGDWNGYYNTLINYGDIYSEATGGGGSNADDVYHTEAHGIRMGVWNGGHNHFENRGDITIYSQSSDDRQFIGDDDDRSNATVSSAVISGQGLNGETNVILNYGNLTGEAYAGQNPIGDGTATISGISWSNQSAQNTGEYTRIENWGNITLTARAASVAGVQAHATVKGISVKKVEDTMDVVEIKNYGNMDLKAYGGKSLNLATKTLNDVWAIGIELAELRPGVSALVENHGDIKIFSHLQANEIEGKEEFNAQNFGITFKHVSEKTTILNTGDIEVIAIAPEGKGNVGSRTVGIGSRGPLNVLQTSSGTNFAGVQHFDGHLRNEGKIVARVTGGAQDAWAIRLGEVSDEQAVDDDGVSNVPSLQLSTLGFLEGRIEVGGQQIIIDHSMPRHSVFWTVENFEEVPVLDPITGDPVIDPVTGEDAFILVNSAEWGSPLGPVFFSTDGLSAATFDTSMISAQPSMLASFSKAGRMAESAYTQHALRTSLDASDPVSVWGTLVGSKLKIDGRERNTLDTDTRYGGAIGGFIGVVNPDIAISLHGGILTGDAEIDSRRMRSHESDVTTYFAGTTLTAQMGAFRGHLGARVGRTDFNHMRSVNNNLVFGGIEKATGDQSATWTSVSGQIGQAINVTPTTTATPFAQIDFMYANVDGYSESGIRSAANVSSYSATQTRIQAGLQGAYSLPNNQGSINGSVSVLGDLEGGDDSVNVSLFGDSQSVSVTQNDDYGVRLALGFARPLGGQANFNSGISYVATNSGDTEISGGLGFCWKF